MAANYVIHELISILIMPVAYVCLFLILPIYYIFKFIFYQCSYLKIESMKGKVVVITGASSGIGEQLVYEYAKREASLVIVARRESYLKKVAEKARAFGSPDVFPICADVSNVDDCKRFIEGAVNHFGRLDHLVNNAGIAAVFLARDATDVKKFTAVMDVNFWGSVYSTFFAIPHLRKTRGKIVVNSSATALLHPPTLSFYSASKAAVFGFYESLRVELAPEISVTIATLGFIDSEMTRGKHLSKEGTVKVNPKLVNVKGWLPVMKSRDSAKAIVDVVCRGGRYVTEPKYYSVIYLLKYLCPEIMEWFYHNIWLQIFARSCNDEAIHRSDNDTSTAA